MPSVWPNGPVKPKLILHRIVTMPCLYNHSVGHPTHCICQLRVISRPVSHSHWLPIQVSTPLEVAQRQWLSKKWKVWPYTKPWLNYLIDDFTHRKSPEFCVMPLMAQSWQRCVSTRRIASSSSSRAISIFSASTCIMKYSAWACKNMFMTVYFHLIKAIATCRNCDCNNHVMKSIWCFLMI